MRFFTFNFYYFILFVIIYLFIYLLYYYLYIGILNAFCVVYGGIPVPVADGEAATTEGAAAPPTTAPSRAKKNAKREITMALWSLDDCYVVTALSDHSIKVPLYPPHHHRFSEKTTKTKTRFGIQRRGN